MLSAAIKQENTALMELMDITHVSRLIVLWTQLMPDGYPAPSSKQFRIWLASYGDATVCESIITMAAKLMGESYEKDCRAWPYASVIRYASGIMRNKSEQVATAFCEEGD